MKFVMLLDSSNGDAKEIVDSIPNKRISLINTKHCDEPHEYRYLFDSIENFSQSDEEILLASFSGKQSIIRDLGDECSEMILTLSDKKESRYYTKCPKEAFLDLLSIFEKETN